MIHVKFFGEGTKTALWVIRYTIAAIDTPQRGFMRSLNSVEVSPYSLTCALILIGCAKQPLDGRLSASAYFSSPIPSFLSYLQTTSLHPSRFTQSGELIAKCRAAVRVSVRGDPTPKRLHCLQDTSRWF